MINSRRYQSPSTLTPSTLLPASLSPSVISPASLSASALSLASLSPANSLTPISPQWDTDCSMKCLINDHDLHLSEHLGGGCFGVVRKGEWRISNEKTMRVAVKTLRADASCDPDILQDFLQEVNAMYALDHPHLIRLYGVVLTRPMKMVTELAPLGSLLNHLHSYNGVYSLQLLWSYSIQIASGMNYLETRKFIHRDLAARNVLMISESMIKIGDFGLTRILEANDDCYTVSANRKIPFAWCAPESLKFGKFSYSSDVWMFGVTMWEMFTYGQEPWLGLNGRQILASIERGAERLECPDDCPPALYNVMLKCWAYIPKERPNFALIINLLQEVKPEEVKVVQEMNNPFSMPLDAGDVVTVIDAGLDSELWRGQNQRTLTIGPFSAAAISSEDFARVCKSGKLSGSQETLSVRNDDLKKEMKARAKDDQGRRGHCQARDGSTFRSRRLSRSMDIIPDWEVNGKPHNQLLPEPYKRDMDCIPALIHKPSTRRRNCQPSHFVDHPHRSPSPNPISSRDHRLALPTMHHLSWLLNCQRKDKPPYSPSLSPGGTMIPHPTTERKLGRCNVKIVHGELQRKIREVEEQVHGVTPEKCQEVLRFFGGDVTRAVHHLKVLRLYNMTRFSKEECRRILERFSWNLEAAYHFISYRNTP